LCPSIVDRAAEIALLQRACALAAEGQAQAILITGEMGVGKSRLCSSVKEAAKSMRGFGIVCRAQEYAQSIAYYPIVDGIKENIHSRAALKELLSRLPIAYRQQLLHLLPELACESELEADRTSDEQPDREKVLEHPLNRTLYSSHLHARNGDVLLALVEAFHLMCEESASGPSLIVFEDLQWADEGTLSFFHHLVRANDGACRGDDATGTAHANGPRGIVIGTCRSEALAPGSALLRTIHGLLSQRLVRHIALPALSPEGHHQMLEAILGRAPSAHLASLLFEHSDGNPFVTEELLGALAADGDLRYEGSCWIEDSRATLPLPLSLCGTVLDQLESLDQRSREVLRTAAIIGREFSFDLLGQVTGIGEEELLGILRRLVEQHVLREIVRSAGESYRFRGALMRDVVQSRMLRREQRLLHLRCADALEALNGSSPAGLAPGECVDLPNLIARHFALGGAPGRARPYAITAAERALDLGAYAEAADQLKLALFATPTGTIDRIALLERLGTLRLNVTDSGSGLGALRHARGEATTMGLRWRAAAIAADIGIASWFVDPSSFADETYSVIAQADARWARGQAPDEEAIHLFCAAALGTVLGSSASRANARDEMWAERACAEAKRLGPAADRFTPLAMMAESVILTERKDPAPGLHGIERAIDLATKHGRPTDVIIGYCILGAQAVHVGQDSTALRAYEAIEELEKRSGAVVPCPWLPLAHFAHGRWSSAMEAGRDQITRYEQACLPTPRAQVSAALGHVLLGRGKVEDALGHFLQAWNHLSAAPFPHAAPCLWGLARAEAARGNHAEARATYERLFSWWGETQDRGTVIPMLLDGCLFYLDVKDPHRASSWAAALRRIATESKNPVARAASMQADGARSLFADQTAGSGSADAVTLLRRATDAWRALARPYDEARTLCVLGKATLALGPRDAVRRADADSSLCRAADVFALLGAEADRMRVGEIRRHAGLLSQARRRRTLASRREPFGGLTNRERDVLDLLAAGLTNREIACTLFIAESTAELHVSHVLGKLQCATRAQAAARAIQLGWVRMKDARSQVERAG
jgi:DNA-binding CsgD family transcriptional regulator